MTVMASVTAPSVAATVIVVVAVALVAVVGYRRFRRLDGDADVGRVVLVPVRCALRHVRPLIHSWICSPHLGWVLPYQVAQWLSTPTGVGMLLVMDDYTKTVTNRLKTARGHLDGIIRMVENDQWCPDIMKQLAAVQGTLESTSREVFRHHLETHVADAVSAGRGAEIIDELMETLKYDKRVMRPTPE